MKLSLRFSCLPALLLFTGAVLAQSQPAPPATVPPPVPGAILNAKTIFISNAGSDSGLFPHPFSGDPDRAYVEFYEAVQGLHHYQLVADPAQADLVFELRLTAPNGPQSPNKATGASDPLPMLRLVIYDRPTHYVLWALTESIAPADLQKNHDRNFDMALAAVMDDLKHLTQPPSPPSTP
jgi:hypothetical protein